MHERPKPSLGNLTTKKDFSSIVKVFALMYVAKPRRIRLVNKKSFMPKEFILIHKIAQNERNDCSRKTNKRKLSDREKAGDQNQEEVEEI
ncbi:hypothetical protein V6N13_038042 [Hibiscus sabdariffa]